MSVLSREAILRSMREKDPLVVTPILEESQIGDASVDARLGHEFLIFRRSSIQNLDSTQTDRPVVHRLQERVRISLFQSFVLHPGQLVLGATLEYISLPASIAASVEGRSSWGRLGLFVATASTIAPGFKGCITLELVNSGEVPIVLYPGVRIAQFVFHRTEGSSEYSGKYKCPTGPQFTRIYDDREIQLWGRKEKNSP